MRYQNWDVLLFPGSSRIPIQEFDTKYHVFPQQNGHPVSDLAGSSESASATFDVIDKLPMLTSFIPSLDQGAAFRVSIHCWEPPKASRILSNIMTVGEVVVYEAKVYIDGRLVSQKLFGDQATWPEVIEFVGTIQSGTTGKVLRFPPFYSEILDQAHWNAGAAFGRIKVVIAEGVIQQSLSPGNNTAAGFDRLRDVVAFSFQHAPLQILEYSAIAWPNARAVRKVELSIPQSRSMLSKVVPASNYEAHAHSPQRYEKPRAEARVSGQNTFGKLIDTKRSVNNTKDARSKTGFDAAAKYDPFLGPNHISLRNKSTQSSSHDVSMPDYTSIRTTRSHTGTEMSDISYRGVDFQKHMDEAAVVEIVHALSPAKREELFKALSPQRQQPFQAIRSSINTSPGVQNMQNTFHAGDSGIPLEISDGTLGRQHPRVTGSSVAPGGLQKSSMLGDPTKLNIRDRLSTAGNKYLNANSPGLPGSWQDYDNEVFPSWMDNKIMTSDPLRPRSSSMASKRKRTISNSHGLKTPEKPQATSRILKSPSRNIATPIKCTTPGEGDVSLSGSKWAKKT